MGQLDGGDIILDTHRHQQITSSTTTANGPGLHVVAQGAPSSTFFPGRERVPHYLPEFNRNPSKARPAIMV